MLLKLKENVSPWYIYSFLKCLKLYSYRKAAKEISTKPEQMHYRFWEKMAKSKVHSNVRYEVLGRIDPEKEKSLDLCLNNISIEIAPKTFAYSP